MDGCTIVFAISMITIRLYISKSLYATGNNNPLETKTQVNFCHLLTSVISCTCYSPWMILFQNYVQ